MTVFGRFAEIIQSLKHNCMVNMLIDDAVSFDREHYVVSLDSKDAFGSIPHELTNDSLRCTGLNADISKIILVPLTRVNKMYKMIRRVVNGLIGGQSLSKTRFNLIRGRAILGLKD
jgi:hypothetical protein